MAQFRILRINRQQEIYGAAFAARRAARPRLRRGREQAERLANAVLYIVCCVFIRRGRVIAVSLTGKSLSLRRY